MQTVIQTGHKQELTLIAIEDLSQKAKQGW